VASCSSALSHTCLQITSYMHRCNCKRQMFGLHHWIVIPRMCKHYSSNIVFAIAA
jgi:hypothetical protein